MLMEPGKLDPEVKWRSMVSIFLNYIVGYQKILAERYGKETAREIRDVSLETYWRERAQAFIEPFALEPGEINNVCVLKRTMAALFDIKYLGTLTEGNDVVIDEADYRFCPVRAVLKNSMEDICDFCERMGKIFIEELDPNFTHKISIEGGVCRHITMGKPENREEI